MQLRMGQGNLAEGLIAPTVERNVTLDRIAVMLDWPALEALLDGVYASPTGRPRVSRGHATARPAAASLVRTNELASGTHKRAKLKRCGLEAKQTGHLRDCDPQSC